MTRQSGPILMTIVMILIAVSAIVYIRRAPRGHSQYISAPTAKLTRVVSADRNIAENQTITADDVVELDIDDKNTVPAAFTCQDLVIGAKSKKSIPFRTIISAADVVALSSPTAPCPHSPGSLFEQVPTRTFVVVEDVKEGALINHKVLLEKRASDAPDDAAHNIWQIVGRPSKYGLYEGNVASEFDADHDGKTLVSVYTAAHAIHHGDAITNDDLLKISLPANQCPGTAITERELLTGCHAHVDIPKNAIVRAFQADLIVPQP